MSALQDILTWSMERPLWQRDALRRILTQSNITASDIAELTNICLAQHGIDNPENPAPAPIPLSQEHIPLDNESAKKVQLISLRNVQGVNALASDQHMSFEPDGLTIVFGYNGSGKSGYARILRSLCHARNRNDSILSNVFDEGNQPIPSAIVDYRVAGANQLETWQQGKNSNQLLKQISFFDTACASVYVDEVNEIAFTPYGLDVLPKLVNICQQVSGSINSLKTDLERTRPASLMNPQAAEGTVVRTLLDELNKDSDLSIYKDYANLTQDEANRIAKLDVALGPDPASRARELRSKATRLQRLKMNIDGVSEALSNESVANIQLKLKDYIAKKAAAKTAAEQAFSGQPLSGIGEEVWLELWEAAREYSEKQAYPEKEFPFTGDDARCVLCQQPISEDTKQRLTAFEAFIKAETQQAADAAESVLNQTLLKINNLILGHHVFRDYLSDFSDDQQELIKSIRRFHGLAWKMRRKITNSCEVLEWKIPYYLSTSPASELTKFIEQLTAQANELEQVAAGVERQNLLEEKNELVARQWLHTVLEDVEVEIERQKKLDSLNSALSDTATGYITRTNGELVDKYITVLLQNRLKSEINNLGAKFLGIELDDSPGGRFGQKRFKISLHGAQPNTKVGAVLSEGEFRCIALASFLTELSTEQSGSALIFDDPVCSLDHQWRRKVAYRLVQLASERQLIIFTHDIVFLADLVGYCEERSVRLHQCYVRRGPDRPGECIDDIPWAAMKVSKRIAYLKNKFQEIQSIFRRDGANTYEPEARRLYGLLRESWERAVEEVLLNGVVLRFDRVIHTIQLNRLSDITDDDIFMVNEGMTKSSRFLEGHDEAGAVMDPVPEPDELKQDIDELETWIRQIRQRRQLLR